MIKNLLLVGFGGFVGSTLRYLTYLFIDKRHALSFPMSTFTVNIIGSLVLGIIIGLSLKDSVNEHMRLFLAVGICGSYTTFSTFALENISLMSQKDLLTSFIYITASIVLGLAAALAGQWVGKL